MLTISFHTVLALNTRQRTVWLEMHGCSSSYEGNQSFLFAISTRMRGIFSFHISAGVEVDSHCKFPLGFRTMRLGFSDPQLNCSRKLSDSYCYGSLPSGCLFNFIAGFWSSSYWVHLSQTVMCFFTCTVLLRVKAGNSAWKIHIG